MVVKQTQLEARRLACRLLPVCLDRSIVLAPHADEDLCNMKALIHREFVVDVPLERAWEHLARVEAWPSWAKHIKSMIVEPSGGLSPSTVGVFQLANGIKARFAMTEFVPRSHWKWVGNFLWLTIHYDHRFEPISQNRTKMQFIIEAKDLGFGKLVLVKLYAAIYSKLLDKAIPNLIAEINAGQTTGQ
jgi:hypothetical protein